MLAVGYWCMKRTRDVGDFFLGGRTLGPWMSAFAYGTTYFSAVLFIGYAGRLGWGFGIQTMWIVLGNTFVGTLLAWMVLAGRTRDMTARLNAMTMPEFLRARYNSAPLQVISAVIVFVFLVPYSASVYMGLSYLFQKTLGLQYNEALIFLAALTGVYLVMGGYFAVAVSDFIRGIVEFFGVLTMVLLLVSMKGGLFASFTALLDPQYMPGLHAPPPPTGPAVPRLGDTCFAGADHQFRPVGAAADGAEVLFHPQQGRREARHDHRHGLRAVHVVWRVLQRRADASVLHRPEDRPRAHRGRDDAQAEPRPADAVFHHELRAAMAGAHHPADGVLGLDVQPVIAGAGEQLGHRH